MTHKQNQFIKLRAQGRSFAQIAFELRVSKRTLANWNREFAGQIESSRTASRDVSRVEVKNTREEFLKRFLRLQEAAKLELASRPPLHVIMDNFFHVASKLREEIRQALEERNAPAPEHPSSPTVEAPIPGDEQKP